MSNFIINDGVLHKYSGEEEIVVIPDGVTSIQERAFEDCKSITSVIIPHSVTSIGELAFWGCTNIKIVTIADGVSSIGDLAFYGCKSLASITIPQSVTSIGYGAFDGCHSLTEITIPTSITRIRKNTFARCTSLTSITIPESVTEIGDAAFSRCTSLTSITIPDSVLSIDNDAFDGCTALKEVHITDVIAWGSTFFGNYYSNPVYRTKKLYLDGEIITDIEIPEFAVVHGILRKYTGSDDAVVIPDHVTGIGNNAFNGHRSITSVTIPASVTSIGDAAFQGCTSLTDIIIPDGVTSIGEQAFEDCTSLTHITLPDSIMDIGAYCFYNCEKLKTIRFPKMLSVIPKSICKYCPSLQEVIFPEALTQIGDEAFYEARLPAHSLPAGVRVGKQAFTKCYLYGCERPPIKTIPRVHYTLDDNNSTMYFKTYSEEDEERFVKQAEEWRYDTSSTQSHETWYEETASENSYLQKLSAEDFIIQDNELVGVCLIGGTVTSSVWGTDRRLSLESLYFDGRNGVKKIEYHSSAGNDEFSRGNSSVWKLSRKVQK